MCGRAGGEGGGGGKVIFLAGPKEAKRRHVAFSLVCMCVLGGDLNKEAKRTFVFLGGGAELLKEAQRTTSILGPPQKMALQWGIST